MLIDVYSLEEYDEGVVGYCIKTIMECLKDELESDKFSQVGKGRKKDQTDYLGIMQGLEN